MTEFFKTLPADTNGTFRVLGDGSVEITLTIPLTVVPAKKFETSKNWGYWRVPMGYSRPNIEDFLRRLNAGYGYFHVEGEETYVYFGAAISEKTAALCGFLPVSYAAFDAVRTVARQHRNAYVFNDR